MGPILTQPHGVVMQKRNLRGMMQEHQQAERAAGHPTAFPTMKTILTTDWAPHIEATARRLAQVCAVVFVAGWALGTIVHHLNDQLTQLLVRKRRPLALPPARDPEPAAGQVVVHRFAVAPVPARSGFAHTVDPMAGAVHLVREGKSQRVAADLCGVSRSSLQRALKR